MIQSTILDIIELKNHLMKVRNGSILLHLNSNDRLQISKLLSEIFALKLNNEGEIENIDYVEISPEKLGKNIIPVDDIRNFISKTKYKSFSGKSQIFVIFSAEKMEEESQNTLLKTLEEPNSDNIFILITTNPDYLLATIRSRCKYYFLQLESDEANGSVPRLVTEFSDLLFGEDNSKDTVEELFQMSEKIAKIDDSIEKKKYLEALFDIIFRELRSRNEFDKLQLVLKYEKYWKANVNVKLLLQNLVIALIS